MKLCFVAAHIRHDTRRVPRAEMPKRSARRIANAQKAVRRELDAVPLFPELARFRTAEERLDQQDQIQVDQWTTIRRSEAAGWHRLHHRLRQLPSADRDRFLDYWNNATMLPAEAGYANDVLFHMFPRLDWYIEDGIRVGGPAYDTPVERQRMKETFEQLFAKGQTK